MIAKDDDDVVVALPLLLKEIFLPSRESLQVLARTRKHVTACNRAAAGHFNYIVVVVLLPSKKSL